MFGQHFRIPIILPTITGSKPLILNNFLISKVGVVKLQMNSIKTSYNTINIYIYTYTVLTYKMVNFAV
jgi:hypothetical protein